MFDEARPVDQLAWALLNTPEFQRLRRIKQLGVSEFVFPGATHTRFAHCIGVFHTARRLVEIIERELRKKGFEADQERELVAVLAALLHDIGHGPFSHAFEHAYGAVQHARNPKTEEKSHEQWTAEIILNPAGHVQPLLEEVRPGLASEIAILLTSKAPTDIYHAVVSSSFDADRLDYLQRDRLMTGSKAGAIDFHWLMDNLAVEDIDSSSDENEDGELKTPSFCLRERALQAAEAFVLARWHLYCQVYMHKTTRCVEAMIQALLSRFATLADTGSLKTTGVGKSHPLATFFAKKGDTLANYLNLDDAVVWSGIGLMTKASDPVLADLSSRLLERRLYKVLDCESIDSNDEARRRIMKRVRSTMTNVEEFSILQDEAKISAYGEIRADDTQAHKRLMIRDHRGELVELTKRSPVVGAIEPRTFARFFFRDTECRDSFMPPGGLNGR